MPRPQTPFTDPAIPQTAQDRLNLMWRNQQNLLNGWGWADFEDSEYNSGSPFAVVADTPTDLPNDAVVTVINNGLSDTALPVGTGWNPITSKFELKLNDSFVLTAKFATDHAGAEPEFIDVWLDADDADVSRYRGSYSLVKGAGVIHYINHTTFGYVDAAMATNGFSVRVSAGANSDIWDIRFLMQILYREDTTV